MKHTAIIYYISPSSLLIC